MDMSSRPCEGWIEGKKISKFVLDESCSMCYDMNNG